jgi:hypothetical protein
MESACTSCATLPVIRVHRVFDTSTAKLPADGAQRWLIHAAHEHVLADHVQVIQQGTKPVVARQFDNDVPAGFYLV